MSSFPVFVCIFISLISNGFGAGDTMTDGLIEFKTGVHIINTAIESEIGEYGLMGIHMFIGMMLTLFVCVCIRCKCCCCRCDGKINSLDINNHGNYSKVHVDDSSDDEANHFI